MRYFLAAVVLVALFASPVANAGTNLARDVAHALRVANAADRRSKRAVAIATVNDAANTSGTNGATGAQGPQGLAGKDGASGSDGASGGGQAGAQGLTGAKGEKGDPGASGAASLVSATNPDQVDIGGAFTQVATITSTGTGAPALVTFDGQANSEHAGFEAVMCELRIDNAVRAERYASLTGSQTVGGSVTATLDVGPHVVGFYCNRQGPGPVDFPAERARLTVLGG